MAQKVKGFKLTPLSIAELVGVVVMGLLIIPFATSAYSNFTAGGNYDFAVDKYVSADYTDSVKALEAAIAKRPELYNPRELLGMTLYYQNDLAKAEATYSQLSRATDLSSGEERRPLALLAVQSLKLIRLAKTGNSIEDPAYTEAATEVGKLASKKMRYLEPKIVKVQLDLDALTAEKMTASARKQILEAARGELEKIEAAANKKGELSPWGATVLFNSLGLVYYYQALMEYERLEKLTLNKRDAIAKYGAVSELSAQAVTALRRAVQYKLDWVVPWSNLERALAFKLVEKGLNNGSYEEFSKIPTDKRDERMKWRVYWIRLTNDFVVERDEHRNYLKYGRSFDLKKQWKDEPTVNDYTLKNSLGWAYTMVFDKVHDPGEKKKYTGSSRLRDAIKVNGNEGIANYNLARSRAVFWKQYEGLESIERKMTVTTRQESYDFYKEALKNSGTMSDPLRRVRLNNNFGVFLFMGWKQAIPAAKQLEEALKDYKGEVEQNPKLARQAAREKLGAKLVANLKAVYQAILDGGNKPEVKEAYKIKLDQLNRG